jgi:hypothetical protein
MEFVSKQSWLRIQTLLVKSDKKLVLRPRQEQLLQLLRDHGRMRYSHRSNQILSVC